MEALVATALGCVRVDLEDGNAELTDDPVGDVGPGTAPELSLPLLVAAAEVGPRIAAVVDRRPPLMLSDDGGRTWREAGGGLPAGVAVAIDEDDPDLMLYASDSRLYVSEDGGLFWRSLPPELIGITAVAFA
jgi:hypothetical protein